MSEHPIQGLMGTTMEKIRDMVDVNTIIGDPIVTPDGTTIIPVSKGEFRVCQRRQRHPLQDSQRTVRRRQRRRGIHPALRLFGGTPRGRAAVGDERSRRLPWARLWA